MVKKASGILGFNKYRSWNVMLQLYNMLLRPHLSTVYSSSRPSVGRMSLTRDGYKHIYEDVTGIGGFKL